MSDNNQQNDFVSIYSGERIDEGVGKGLTALQPGDIDDTLTQTGKAAGSKAAGDAIAAKYTKPASGIPSADLAPAVQTSLGRADSAYQKPSGGIPADDMSSAVQTALTAAGTALQTTNNAGAHNSIFKGRNLGSSVTAEQWASIAAGTFDGLYIGDYWTSNNVNYMIADFNYFLHTGNTETTAPHVVIVPNKSLKSAKMNATSTTEGGYIGSDMYTAELADIRTAAAGIFGSGHILSHRDYFCNAVTNGKPSGSSWYDSTVELMTEAMVYGTTVFGVANIGSSVPSLESVGCKQLSLFRLCPELIGIRAAYWLRDVVSGTQFADVAGNGQSHYSGATASSGVRPYFCIY